MKVYGIVNCNTVKAARAWLDVHGKKYDFVDFKKTPPTPQLLARWCDAFGWESVLNRRGTTWRTLDTVVQATVKDASSAIAVMLDKPSVIKRPIVDNGEALLIGFDHVEYAKQL